MKLYCKIKRDGKWSWFGGDSPWKIDLARELCECRICALHKLTLVSQEKESICLGGANEQELIDHFGEEEE